MLVNVQLRFIGKVDVEAVLWRGYHKNRLVLVRLEELRLAVKLRVKLVYHDYLLSDEVHAEDAINFGKHNSVTIETFGILKMEVH